MSQIQNFPHIDPRAKTWIGQLVITIDPITGELIKGTVTEIVDGTVNVIKTIKVIRSDGRIDFMEVAELIVKAASLLGPLQKLGRWIANLFRRKDKRKPL
jgi:hypothetical protein